MQNQPGPDYLLLKAEGAVLAGSGISYRQLLLRNGQATTAGIMAGSWTLPEARGRGCCTRIIEESASITEQLGHIHSSQIPPVPGRLAIGAGNPVTVCIRPRRSWTS